MREKPSPRSWKIKIRLNTLLFLAVHVASVVGIVWLGISWQGIALALASYYIRMIVVTAAYHRYFSHKAYKTSRPFQFILALAAQSAAQNGVLWWASHHRHHHRYADTPKDIHSVSQRGFWYAHWGWILCNDWADTEVRLVKDLYAYPELRFLNHPYINGLPTILLALLFLFIGGTHGLVWGYFVSTTLLWHGSFSINSLAHLIGKRRYETKDDSRNNWLLALLMTGEGWHNNHHYFPAAARQGHKWYEIDTTYYCLRLLAFVGLIWDLREPPAKLQAATAEATSHPECPAPSSPA